MSKAISKYLRLYAEPECALLNTLPDAVTFRQCVVIPCYNEDVSVITRLELHSAVTSTTLLILVVNQPSGPITPQNATLIRHFDSYSCLWREAQLGLFQHPSRRLHCLLVDACGPGPAARTGVGLARKIGCDLALALQYRQQLLSPWIYNTDGDATLPDNYFQALPEDAAAAVFEFEHRPNGQQQDAVHEATHLYEQALRYYVRGLQWAGSPYAFQTIGSTMAVNGLYYAQARGFPKRAAGEDFYLLNKLAKLAPIHQAHAIVVRIDSRLSSRVPFGTGPAVSKILTLDNPGADYVYYSPQCFVVLRQWLQFVPHLVRHQQAGLDGLPDIIQSALQDAGIAKLWPHLQRQTNTPETAEQALHRWFDAFQTLKFIRRLQAHHFPDVPLKIALQEAPF